MYRRLNIFLIIGAVFTIITGTLLHFVYEWSGESLFVGIFSPYDLFLTGLLSGLQIIYA